MIPNQWYAILESSEVRSGRPVGVKRLGERLAFWRDGNGELHAVRDQCPHRGAALSAGKVTDGHIACPFHGFQFDAEGRCRLIPANGRAAPIPEAFRVDSFPVREAQGLVWLWWGESRPELPPLPFFEDLAQPGFTYATFRDRWHTHYTRAIENQLDVVHLPFVHRTTIGRGKRTLVDGPRVAASEEKLFVWVENRVDDGTKARRAAALPPPARGPFLEFHFPNLWQLLIAPTVRIFVAFAPVDEENTVLYVRYYHRNTTLPGLRQAVAFAGMLGSILIVRQDKPVVETQLPCKSDITMREKLVPGDSPIVQYRGLRHKLMARGPVA